MVIGPDVSDIRAHDHDEVDALLRAAFPGPEEAMLVRDLRCAGVLVSEQIIRWQGRIGAYAAISRMVAPEGWFALAPVAVLPEWQNGALGIKGANAGERLPCHFGTKLVSRLAAMFNAPSLPEARGPRDGKPTLVVLGKPTFYARCGFSSDRAARLVSDYPVDHLLIARPGDDVPEVRLVYPPAFDRV
jgi:putative acetyltransferase